MTCGHNTMVTFDCVDGYLHDMDYDYVDPEDVTYPCPKCNTKEYLENAKNDAESTVSGSWNGCCYTGVSIWENAVETATKLNKEVALKTLSELKTVVALYERDEDFKCLEKVFTYE